MQEKFDLNKKIEPTEYRKNLADKLRGTIKESGFEEAREDLKKEKGDTAEKHDPYFNENPKSVYEKAKELKLVQWLLEKHPGDYDKIQEQIQKLGLSSEVSHRISEYFRNQVIEGVPNLEKLKGSHSDLILQPGKDNKFISLEIIKPEINQEKFFNEGYFKNEKFYSFLREEVLEKGDEGLFEILKKERYLSQKLLTSIVIARPYKMDAFYNKNNKDVYTVSQHYQIKDEFVENRDIDRVPKAEGSSSSRMETVAPLILRKSEIPVLDVFLRKVASIVKEETDYTKAQNRLRELSFPDFQEGVSEIGGGYIELKEDGIINIFGRSEKYKGGDKRKVVEVLNQDFPDKKFEVN